MSEVKNPHRKNGEWLHPDSLMYKMAMHWDQQNLKNSTLNSVNLNQLNALVSLKNQTLETLTPRIRLPASTVAKASRYQAVRRSLSQTPRVSQPEMSTTITEESPPQTPKAPEPLI